MIRKDSWHFKLANFGYTRVFLGDSMTVCKYLRYVWSGFWHLFLTIFSITFFSVWTLAVLYDLAMWLFGSAPLHVWTIIMLGGVGGALGIAFLIAGFSWLVDMFVQTARRAEESPKTSLSNLVYRKYKEKICFTVEVEKRK